MSGEEPLKQQLSRWYNALEPYQALDLTQDEGPDRERYTALDAWEDDDGNTHALRGPPVVQSIVDGIELSSTARSGATTHLFAGFPGTGKSTELSRLARELRELGTYAVLRVSAREYHHLSDALSIEELVLVLAGGIGEAAIETLGEQQLHALAKEGIWARIGGFLKQQQITFKLGPVEIKPALRAGGSLKEQLRGALAQNPNALRDFLHTLVTDIAAAIAPRQLVILVDDLEKYYARTDRIDAVYQQMADLFFHHSDILRLPVGHIVYTVPPYLALLNRAAADAYGGRLHILPSVKVCGRPPDRPVHGAGVAALERILAERADLDALFGKSRSSCVRDLVLASGGHLRDLCHLLREVIALALHDGLPVGPKAITQAVDRYAATRMLLKEDHEILAEVQQRGDLASLDKHRLGRFAGAIDQHLLLCYWNGEFWYDVQPLVQRQITRYLAAGMT